MEQTLKDQLMPLKQLADDNIEYTYAFAAIGAGIVGIKVGQCLYSCYKYMIRPSYNLQKKYGNNWAVVTGATDGIGKSYAFELARRGFKVCLFGRNAEKLDEVSKIIKSTYDVETKSILFDFNTHYTQDKIIELNEKLMSIDKVSILINNVGAASYDPLVKMSDENIHKQLNINVVGNTVMSKLMIPKLLANNGKSGCIFTGSSAYEAANPNLAVYSASKAYEHQLCISLAGEHKDDIDFMVTRTSAVKTNMNSGRYLFTITADQHAKQCLDKLGHDTETHGKL